MALSDTLGILASPLTIIERTEESRDIAAITTLVDENQVEKIIAGLPRSMDGTIGPQAEKAKAFVDGLAARTKVPIEFRDERLTTVSARRLMQANRKKSRRNEHDDAFAAAVILQSYLDERPNAYEPPGPI